MLYWLGCWMLLCWTALGAEQEQRTIQRLVGGHLNLDDAGLLTAGAGEGLRPRQEEEEKKTLSQQVAEGKYGLIQRELFSEEPSRPPGVLSYSPNQEVPRDDERTRGGLSPEEIWLAEDHLLVLKGGSFPEHGVRPDAGAPPWPPIDDYTAPRRPVKLPSNPKVPPPFPVQLQENGPVRYLFPEGAAGPPNGTVGAESRPPPDAAGGAFFIPAPRPDSPDFAAGKGALPAPPVNLPQGFAPLNRSYFASFPPGAMFLPPPSNQTDLYDEDDPSIYYPPPYSFYYHQDNTTQVPPGPLVPGIILPPPPDFFAPLEKPRKPAFKPYKTKMTTTTSKPPIIISLTTTEVPPQIQPPTTPMPPTSQVVYPDIQDNVINIVTPPPRIVLVTPAPRGRPNRTSYYVLPRKKPTPTILKPINVMPLRTTTSAPRVVYAYYDRSQQPQPQLQQQQQPLQKGRTVVSSTPVPLKAYFSTPSAEIESNSVAAPPPPPPPPPVQVPRKLSKPQAEYYYYEEEQQTNSVTTTRSPVYPGPPAAPYDELRPVKIQPQIYYVTARPPPAKYYKPSRPLPALSPIANQYLQEAELVPQNSFESHIDRLRNQIRSYYTTTPRPPIVQPQSKAPKPVYQYSFEAADYQKQRLQSQYAAPIAELPRSAYYATARPDYEYATPNPYYYQKEGFYAGRQKPQAAPTTPRAPKKLSRVQNEEYFVQNVPQYLQRPPAVEVHYAGAPPTNQYDLSGDIAVNYKQPRPPINPHAEYISEGQPGAFISYRLPGNGAHFYFLTPQLAQNSRQQQPHQQQDIAAYVAYAKQDDPRIVTGRRGRR